MVFVLQTALYPRIFKTIAYMRSIRGKGGYPARHTGRDRVLGTARQAGLKKTKTNFAFGLRLKKHRTPYTRPPYGEIENAKKRPLLCAQFFWLGRRSRIGTGICFHAATMATSWRR